jgi:hypothetical protein
MARNFRLALALVMAITFRFDLRAHAIRYIVLDGRIVVIR